MDLRQLTALVAVADTGSFSAAARALHTVQSNVSTHIARLERELGVTLVDRATAPSPKRGPRWPSTGPADPGRGRGHRRRRGLAARRGRRRRPARRHRHHGPVARAPPARGHQRATPGHWSSSTPPRPRSCPSCWPTTSTWRWSTCPSTTPTSPRAAVRRGPHPGGAAGPSARRPRPVTGRARRFPLLLEPRHGLPRPARRAGRRGRRRRSPPGRDRRHAAAGLARVRGLRGGDPPRHRGARLGRRRLEAGAGRRPREPVGRASLAAAGPALGAGPGVPDVLREVVASGGPTSRASTAPIRAPRRAAAEREPTADAGGAGRATARRDRRHEPEGRAAHA